MAGSGMEGVYEVVDRGDKHVVAHVKVEHRAADDGTYVFVKWGGKGEWEEDPAAFGLLFGEHGSVERVGKS